MILPMLKKRKSPKQKKWHADTGNGEGHTPNQLQRSDHRNLNLEIQNETELDVRRTARNRYCRTEFSTDFSVHRGSATGAPL